MTKQIDIKELIPFMNEGWVAMDIVGDWLWFDEKPVWAENGYTHRFFSITVNLSTVFNIEKVKPKNSLIKIERK